MSEPSAAAARLHALRVRVPIRYLVALQRLRFSRDESVTTIVRDALDLYFRRIGLEGQREPPGEP